jgi:hypothetical protein
MVNALKVPAPVMAATAVVPPMVQPEEGVIVIVSVEFVPYVSTLPYGSVTETLNGANTAAATTVAGGWVVKRSFVAVLAVTVIPVLTAEVRASVASDAVRVHGLIPPSIITAVKLREPPTSNPVVVPAMVQDEEIEIASVCPPVLARAPAAFCACTVNARVDPAVTVEAGSTEKPSFVAAPEYTVTEVLVVVGVARVVVVSAATKLQVPVWVNTRLKLATPEAAGLGFVPVKVQPEVIVMVSVKLLLATLPSVPSIVTENVTGAPLTVAVEDG